MQDSTNAGQVRCSTGRMQDRTEQSVHVRGRKGHMQLRSDAGGQVRCIAGLMQDRTEAVQDRCRTVQMQSGHMQVMTDAVQDICMA